MKLKNLLILGTMLLSVGSVSAEIVDGVRQAPKVPKPNVTAQEIKWGETMYMFNVDAGQFFLGANDWNTRASVGRKGYKVYIDQYMPDGATWDGKQIYWRDSVEVQSAIKHVWLADGGAMWVDNSSAADRLYNLVPQGNNVYRLAPGMGNPNHNSLTYPDVYVGVVDAHKVDANTRLFWNISPTKEGAQLDWIFISAEEYNATLEQYTADCVVYDSLMTIYNTAQNLRVALDEAKSKNIDVAAQEAVYLDENLPVEEIDAALVIVKNALAKYAEENVDPLNPEDKTSMIVNPNMDNTTGWTTIEGVQNRGTHTNVTTGAYEGTVPAFEHWNNGAYTGKFYQVIKGVPNGLYKLKAAVMGDQQPAAEGTGLYLYANEYKTPVVSNIPAYYIVFAEVTEGTLEIGWTAEKKHSQWISSDTYTLFYYGNKGEATYAGAATELVNANMTKYDNSEARMSAGTVDVYKTALGKITASDMATLNEAQADIEKAIADVEANINGWNEYEALIAKANEVRGDPSYSPSTAMTTMAGYAMRQAPAILKALALPTEELLAEVKKLNDMIETAIRESLKVDSEVTSMFLVNPNYEEGTKGWSGNWGAVAGPDDNKCMEAYAIEWDAYQIVKDAPQGVYEVSLQGFYRVERGTKAWELYVNGGQTCPGSVYVNNKSTPVKCVFDEALSSKNNIYSGTTKDNGAEGNFCRMWDEAKQDSTVTPNDMTSAGEAFKAGMYVSSANGIVAQKGDELRLGVKGKQQSATWVIWDNFKMYYRGKQLKYTMPYLQEAIAAAGENLKKPMDKDTKVIVETAKANAEALLESTDENAVFDALVALYESNDSVEAASAIFGDLEKAAVSIEEAIMANSETATQQAQLNAQNLLTAISEGLNGASLTKAEAKALLAQVEKVLMDLRMPDVTNASDDTPVKFTQLLKTPNFDKDGANSTEGWTGANGGYGNGDEAKALIYEFYNKTFHIYQELKNIPNGTYRIEVSAFNRHGSSVNEYFSYQANPDTSSVYVYGMDCTGDSLIYKQPVARLAKHASLDYFSAYDFDSAYFARVDTLKNVEMGADSIVWVVNSPRGASHEFDDLERYTNTVYVEVTNGILRLGMEKTEVAKGDTKVTWDGRGMKHGDDWVTMDNWKLYYHGTASKFKPTSVGEVLVAAPGAPVKVEVYNLNGVRLNKPQKGVNIIRTIHADGQVTVKKRLVK